MGAGLSSRRTAANTGVARAMHRSVVFAGKPAPTGILVIMATD
ncbi:diguanylate cyclase [Pseudomonas oryziphila]|uniref:Diguanylate cyclase n=1 Tax=Pseudomonas entomophila TaxID=312306 RepID=A0A3Q8TZQ7_9PSED|nr:diguanylate cyclase [Pseudomonas oryziphila]